MNSLKVFRSGQVHEDLMAIYLHIGKDRPAAAEEVLDRIESTIELLSTLPGLGNRWKSPDPRLSGLPVAVVTPYRNYLVFFRRSDRGVEVYRVVHGARDLEQIVDQVVFDLDDEI